MPDNKPMAGNDVVKLIATLLTCVVILLGGIRWLYAVDTKAEAAKEQAIENKANCKATMETISKLSSDMQALKAEMMTNSKAINKQQAITEEIKDGNVDILLAIKALEVKLDLSDKSTSKKDQK